MAGARAEAPPCGRPWALRDFARLLNFPPSSETKVLQHSNRWAQPLEGGLPASVVGGRGGVVAVGAARLLWRERTYTMTTSARAFELLPPRSRPTPDQFDEIRTRGGWPARIGSTSTTMPRMLYH